ncbi:asparagine synthase-related protein [Nitrospirillum iridis]|uniref:asparagine synthase (glutamine-hydrolyzing) n=1 Tax=Nitrospirillum iridis TaxID=765888 RepID=A0A7X0B0V6_9PROT|nr:asparagine synthase-related protein [Nitrospirillum iridis]MBB6253717.1 asparagine synthase (glutamine-hydrolyzing) [Nitrospirillum iridis]
MSVVFGASGCAAPTSADRYSSALGRYPGVRRVGTYHDDVYFVAQGLETGGGAPHVCAGGRHVLALEGWLANREDLARSLDLVGELPADSVMVATALLRWGREALTRLHGDFVLAWWDAVERRLLLAADRTGGRALFYHDVGGLDTGGGIVFANIPGPLFMHPLVPRVLDPAMVARATFTPSLDLQETCFRGVKQLLPGHMLDWTVGAEPRVSRYWRLDPTRRLRLRRDGDYVEAARELLDKVVKEALPREGIAVSMLSGGLDSGAVATTLARLMAPTALHTVTVRPDPASPLPAGKPRQFQDEWDHAQATARLHPSIMAHGVPATLDSLEDLLRSGFHWGGRPPVHLMAAAWMSAGWRQARRLGATTVFVGRAGNATLSASILPTALRPRLMDVPQALYTAALAASNGMNAMPYLRAFAPDWLRDWHASLRGTGAVWQRRTALRREAAERIDMDGVWCSHFSGDRRAAWGRRARLRLMERTWTARTLSACQHFRDGVERRDPLGDVRLAEFCLAIPPDQFTRFGQDRFLARRVLADRLPPEVLQERRTGRQVAEWFDWVSRHRAWLAAELDGIDASALGRDVIDVPRLRAILDDWPANADVAEPRYIQVMNVLGRGVAVGSFIRWAEGSNM